MDFTFFCESLQVCFLSSHVLTLHLDRENFLWVKNSSFQKVTFIIDSAIIDRCRRSILLLHLLQDNSNFLRQWLDLSIIWKSRRLEGNTLLDNSWDWETETDCLLMLFLSPYLLSRHISLSIVISLYFFISSIVSELLRTQYLYTSVPPPTAPFPIANMKSFEGRKICPTEIRMNYFCRNWLKVTAIERKTDL